jgi:hypothetical protein
MDWNAIIVALLAVLGSYLGNVALTRRKNRDDAIKEAEHQATLDERMKSIEHKLDEHNRYAEKLTSIEKSMVSMQKDIEYLRKEAS